MNKNVNSSPRRNILLLSPSPPSPIKTNPQFTFTQLLTTSAASRPSFVAPVATTTTNRFAMCCGTSIFVTDDIAQCTPRQTFRRSGFSSESKKTTNNNLHPPVVSMSTSNGLIGILCNDGSVRLGDPCGGEPAFLPVARVVETPLAVAVVELPSTAIVLAVSTESNHRAVAHQKSQQQVAFFVSSVAESSGTEFAGIVDLPAPAKSLKFSRDGRILVAMCGAAGCVCINVAQRGIAAVVSVDGGICTAAAITSSPGGEYVVAASCSTKECWMSSTHVIKSAQLRASGALSPSSRLVQTPAMVNTLDFFHDETSGKMILLSACDDHSLTLWSSEGSSEAVVPLARYATGGGRYAALLDNFICIYDPLLATVEYVQIQLDSQAAILSPSLSESLADPQ